MKKYSVQVVLGAILALAACELLLQALPVISGVSVAPTGVYNPFEHYLPRQQIVYSRGWAFDNVTRHWTNDQGFVNSHDFSAGHDFLIIGDSYIEALMLDYPDTVQGRLDSMTGGRVVAAGASGNGLADFLTLASFYGLRLRPATTILFVQSHAVSDLLSAPASGHNGFRESEGRVWVEHSPYREPRWKPLLQSSALGRYFWYNLKFPQWLSKLQLRASTGSDDSTTNEHERRDSVLRYFFAELRRLSAENGTQVVLLIDGDREAIYRGTPLGHVAWNAAERAQFIEFARHYDCTVVDMQPAFERHWAQFHERMDFLPVDGHWNRLAHLLAAQELAKQTGIGLSK